MNFAKLDEYPKMRKLFIDWKSQVDPHLGTFMKDPIT